MPKPTDSLIKVYCRIDGSEFDAILPTMIDAATALASHETGVDYTTAAMPEAVQQWCAAQISHWIDNPSAASDKQMHKAPYIDRLLDPYRSYTWTPPAA